MEFPSPAWALDAVDSATDAQVACIQDSRPRKGREIVENTQGACCGVLQCEKLFATAWEQVPGRGPGGVCRH